MELDYYRVAFGKKADMHFCQLRLCRFKAISDN